MKKNLVAKILVALVATTAAFGLVGCGVTTTETYTESYTDENGETTTTTTTTVTDENGETTTETTTETTSDEVVEDDVDESVDEVTDEDAEYIVASLSIENETNFDFVEMYFTTEDTTDWGEDTLGDDAPLAVGEVITFNDAVTYVPESGLYCDLCAVDADGSSIEFTGLDISFPEDVENIYILIEYDAETDTYTVTAQ